MSGTELVPASQGYHLSPAEYALLEGDLSKLNEGERLSLYNSVCGSLGLNPMTAPFGYIRLSNKLTLYAKKDCTDQLRKLHGVSITDLTGREMNGAYIVTAKAQDARGRIDVGTGAVSLEGLRGEAMCNALMKCETKAKRRVTLSICGLGMLDESEAGSIPGAVVVTDVSAPRTDDEEVKAAADKEAAERASAAAAKLAQERSAAQKLRKAAFLAMADERGLGDCSQPRMVLLLKVLSGNDNPLPADMASALEMDVTAWNNAIDEVNAQLPVAAAPTKQEAAATVGAMSR